VKTVALTLKLALTINLKDFVLDLLSLYSLLSKLSKSKTIICNDIDLTGQTPLCKCCDRSVQMYNLDSC